MPAPSLLTALPFRDQYLVRELGRRHSSYALAKALGVSRNSALAGAAGFDITPALAARLSERARALARSELSAAERRARDLLVAHRSELLTPSAA